MVSRQVRGFTLIEVGLALTVGIILAGAGLLAYEQARDSAGDSIARRKVADLQALVESFYSNNGYFPRLNDFTSGSTGGLCQMWAARRNDATASPWGGPVLDNLNFNNDCRAFASTNASMPPAGGCNGIQGTDDMTTNNPGFASGPQALGDSTTNSGILYYYRLQKPGAPQPYGFTFFDYPTGSWVSGNGYVVAAAKKMHNYYFTTSGR